MKRLAEFGGKPGADVGFDFHCLQLQFVPYVNSLDS